MQSSPHRPVLTLHKTTSEKISLEDIICHIILVTIFYYNVLKIMLFPQYWPSKMLMFILSKAYKI